MSKRHVIDVLVLSVAASLVYSAWTIGVDAGDVMISQYCLLVIGIAPIVTFFIFRYRYDTSLSSAKGDRAKVVHIGTWIMLVAAALNLPNYWCSAVGCGIVFLLIDGFVSLMSFAMTMVLISLRSP